MTSGSENGRGLRDLIASRTEDRLGRALTELLESPLLSGAIGRAFDAKEKAAQAQELAMGALNLPSAADIERLTRRLRSVSQRLEAVEEVVSRLDRGTGSRLAAIEQRLESLGGTVEAIAAEIAAGGAASKSPPRPRASSSAKRRSGSAPTTKE